MKNVVVFLLKDKVTRAALVSISIEVENIMKNIYFYFFCTGMLVGLTIRMILYKNYLFGLFFPKISSTI